MKAPTIGRIVHYCRPDLAAGDCWPAIVVKAGDKDCVNLTAFGPRGETEFALNILYNDPEGDAPPFAWHWPEDHR